MANTKNKVTVKWPKSTFTIQKLQELNPSNKNITLRFKVKKAMEAGEIVEIGKNPSSMGRPTLVFGKSDVSVETLTKLKKSGVILNENYEKLLGEPSSTVVATFRNETAAPVEQEESFTDKKSEEVVTTAV